MPPPPLPPFEDRDNDFADMDTDPMDDLESGLDTHKIRSRSGKTILNF
jgi:hypothetical protein